MHGHFVPTTFDCSSRKSTLMLSQVNNTGEFIQEQQVFQSSPVTSDSFSHSTAGCCSSTKVTASETQIKSLWHGCNSKTHQSESVDRHISSLLSIWYGDYKAADTLTFNVKHISLKKCCLKKTRLKLCLPWIMQMHFQRKGIPIWKITVCCWGCNHFTAT